MTRLENEAALATDVAHLMDALPPLANVQRYGNVRRTDTGTVARVIDGLVTRVCIGVPAACASLNDDAAEAMFKRITETNSALVLLQNTKYLAAWQSALRQIADQNGTHGLVAGRCCRLLLDAGVFDTSEMGMRLSLALSLATAPAQAAAWVEGALKGSGLLLLHHDALWQIIDDWLNILPADGFQQVLPLLRRTFSTFAVPERRQMGERARAGAVVGRRGDQMQDVDRIDTERAELVLPLVAQLLGLSVEG
jgi:hypothetical protein